MIVNLLQIRLLNNNGALVRQQSVIVVTLTFLALAIESAQCSYLLEIIPTKCTHSLHLTRIPMRSQTITLSTFRLALRIVHQLFFLLVPPPPTCLLVARCPHRRRRHVRRGGSHRRSCAIRAGIVLHETKPAHASHTRRLSSCSRRAASDPTCSTRANSTRARDGSVQGLPM